MRTRIAIIAAFAILLLLSSVGPAQAGEIGSPEWYTVGQGQASGGRYRLASLAWRVSGTVSGNGYRLDHLEPTLRGSGCCCTYLPCILRGFH